MQRNYKFKVLFSIMFGITNIQTYQIETVLFLIAVTNNSVRGMCMYPGMKPQTQTKSEPCKLIILISWITDIKICLIKQETRICYASFLLQISPLLLPS